MAAALLCFDGSANARHAIERAGGLLGGGPALVLCVWESLGSAILRHSLPGQDLREISGEVVDHADRNLRERAEAVAAEGAELAKAAGFDAHPLALRALAEAAERDETTISRAVVEAADENDASLVVLGTRGRGSVRSVLLGSVSHGVVHHCRRPLLVVPPQEA